MNSTLKMWIVYFSALSLFMTAVRPAAALPASEATQLLNFAQLVINSQRQVEIIYNQAQSIQNQLRNLQKYSRGEWTDVMALVRDLERVVRTGQSLSYTISNIEADFKRRFPGYQAPVDYVESYQGWSATTLDTIQNSLVAAGMQRNDFESEAALLKKLNAMSDNADGIVQVSQAGNQIAHHSVVQLMLLRKLMMDNLQSHVAFMAHTVNKESADQAVANNMIKVIPYEKGKGTKY